MMLKNLIASQVTIPFSGVVLVNTYPVENSVFHPDVIDLMRAVTPTLISTGSKFSINVYPYFDYAYSTDIPLDFALGRSGSLLEAKLRGCRLALDKIGANAVPIIVGETGWPSAGGKGIIFFNKRSF
jgi:exo-beta-1,3-glucanase (GH17 family)